MPLVSGTIPNFINGVSQQPATVRNPSQAEAQVNCVSTAARGLRKRGGTTLVAVSSIGIPVANPDDVACHAYKRTEAEQYHITVLGPTGSVRITNLNDGVVSTTSNPYLITDNAKRDIRFLSVADTTFILNRGKVVTASANNTTPLEPPSNLLNSLPNLSDLYVTVAIGNYGKTYRIDVALQDGTTFFAFTTTPNGGSASDSLAIGTDVIAQALFTNISAQTGPIPNLESALYGNVIHIYATNGIAAGKRIKSFTLSDGFAGQALRGFNQIIDDFSLLPPRASPFSAPVKVVEGASQDNLGYYVRFESDTAGTTGVWRECETLYLDPLAGHKNPTAATARLAAGFDKLTMPIALANVAANVFTLNTVDWSERHAGDVKSAKSPSFVGTTIEGLFFHRNRLGFISESGISLSEADNFFNFFPATVIQVLDSDRIDVQANTTVIDALHSAVPFDRDLIVFGDRTQYRLVGEPLLTPKTVEMKLIASYDNDRQLDPRAIGSRVMFGTARGEFSTFRELYVTNDNTLEAPLITAQVPEYIPSGVRHMSASSADDMMVVCPTEEDALYVYSFYTSGNEKLMSSWSRWEFQKGDNRGLFHPIHAEFLGSKLVITFYDNTLVVVTTMDLSLAPEAAMGSLKLSHLDLGIDYLPAAMFFNGVETRFTVLGGNYFERTTALILSETAPEAGQEVPVVIDFDTSEYVIQGNMTGYDGIRVGAKFDMDYELSTIFLRATRGNATITDTLSRLSLRRMEVVYEETASFSAKVSPEGRAERTSPFPRDDETLRNEFAGIYPYSLRDGVFRFSVNTKNLGTTIRFTDTSPYPVNLLSATWEAQYVRHSKGV